MFTVLIVISAMFGRTLTCQTDARAISDAQAHELARLTLTIPSRDFKGMKFTQEPALRSGPFYWFTITADVPGDASPMLGGFAVNQSTGDVWDPVSCRKLTSKDSIALRRQLTKNLHLGSAEFKRLSRVAPCEP
jgi:hypothetical protein